MKERPIGPWPKGANNIAPLDKIPDGYVRDSTNVDATAEGNLCLRTGYERVYTGTDIRGCLALGSKVLVADGDQLVEFDTLTNSSRVLRTIAAAGVFAGDVLNETLYFCTANECLEYDGTRVRSWGVPDVANQPVVVSAADGGLLEGYYRVAMTYVDADGREGGTDMPLTLYVPASGAIEVTVPTPPAGCTANVYIGPNSGDTVYLQSSKVAAGVLRYTSLRDDTARCATVFLKAPTPGHLVATHNSSLAVAVGNVLHLTTPFRTHLTQRVRGFLQFGGEVGMAVSTGDVLFVSADKTYALTSVETDGITQRTVLEFPAIAGTAVLLPDGRGTWMTQYGQAVTDNDNVSLVSKGAHVPDLSEKGAAGVIDTNGAQQVVTTLKGGNRPNPMAISDFYVGEILNP